MLPMDSLALLHSAFCHSRLSPSPHHAPLLLSSSSALPSLSARAMTMTSPSPDESLVRVPGSFPPVALTREEGKNGKLRAMLEARGIPTVELPCIKTAVGRDRPRLPQVLTEEIFDWVCVTSPESAKVLVEGVREMAGRRELSIASIGAGTSAVLREGGMEPAFTPSRSTAQTLAQELPHKGNNRVLYPASALAQATLESGLADRGFDVTRLNTYTTLGIHQDGPHVLPSSMVEAARAARVVTFGSPSAVKGWTHLTAGDAPSPSPSVYAACIGPTSAEEARRSGVFAAVTCPDDPTMDGWLNATVEAVRMAIDQQRAA
ncbi:unnamed protein product [Vitrella brassicaformis CCMP3155]|uniref:Uroporphyrinogen-III synthase n=2 Tax=Vitrella brassicaformis TaxID=1169539 RepID=A0A0G4GA72_VITBC|nr:unnamed protein product [Vitrella brassicaformis CCMP3155]|eukprot:CEM25869.1 unnamed protein product [Vitrella brassicaformis CCMP3155]